MRAARYHGPEQPLVVEDVPDPTPGPGEVVVRVEACGICASDLHLLHGEMPLPVSPPITVGHEPSGTVAAVGADVPDGWREGDRVAMFLGKPCLQCARCRVGDLEGCVLPQLMGFHYDGAWAEYVTVPWYALTPVPEAVPFEHAAIASDAVSTPFAALVERGALKPGERVGLWGIGGLGTHAVQIARLAGASFIAAIDPLPAARERALALGADVAIDPADDVPARIKEHGGVGLDLALDLVGRPSVVKQALFSLEPRGRVVVVGQSFEHIDAGPGLVLSYRGVSILGHLGYRKQHLEQVLALMASGRLDVSGSITGEVPLERVEEGVKRLTSKEENPVRILVRPNG